MVMNKTKIEIENFKHPHMFERFVNETNPAVCVTGCFDITNLYNRKDKHKLNTMLCFCILQAGQNVEDFHYAISPEKELLYYKNVRTNVIVNGDDGSLYYADLKYYKHFKNFEKEYERVTKYCQTHCEHYQKDNGALLATSAVINYPFTSFSLGMSDEFWDNFVMWGKYIKKEEKVELYISLRFHHATIDGQHAGMFFNELQRQIDIFKD